jgi:hypothetical protein
MASAEGQMVDLNQLNSSKKVLETKTAKVYTALP